MVVNPRFEGGPHIKVNIYPNVHVTATKQQNLVNFTDVAAVVANTRYLIEQLREEFESEFGFVSDLYQLAISKMITRKMYNVCLQP